MSEPLSPIVSEFDTGEQEAEYSQYRQNKAILDMLRYK